MNKEREQEVIDMKRIKKKTLNYSRSYIQKLRERINKRAILLDPNLKDLSIMFA
jgi:uncharacterized Rossmann fold enzyme